MKKVTASQSVLRARITAGKPVPEIAILKASHGDSTHPPVHR
jgi:hypothetical protein